MEIELKESEEGFIIDVFNKENNLVRTKTYWYVDLEEDFRQYLQDMSNDENCDIKTIENWVDWLEEEKEVLQERIVEE